MLDAREEVQDALGAWLVLGIGKGRASAQGDGWTAHPIAGSVDALMDVYGPCVEVDGPVETIALFWREAAFAASPCQRPLAQPAHLTQCQAWVFDEAEEVVENLGLETRLRSR